MIRLVQFRLVSSIYKTYTLFFFFFYFWVLGTLYVKFSHWRYHCSSALLASKSWSSLWNDCQVNVKQQTNLHQMSQLPKDRQENMTRHILPSASPVPRWIMRRYHRVLCLKMLASGQYEAKQVKTLLKRLDIPNTKRSPWISSEKNYSTVVHKSICAFKCSTCLLQSSIQSTKSLEQPANYRLFHCQTTLSQGALMTCQKT